MAKIKSKLNINGSQLSLISNTKPMFWIRAKKSHPELYQTILNEIDNYLALKKDFLLNAHANIKKDWEKKRRHKVSISKRKKRIKNLETGETYKSVTEAMQKLKTNHNQIKKWTESYHFYYKKHLKDPRTRKPVKIIFV